ncbi:MAG: cation:dicarboxylase symporter family transporter [Acidobacteria bacterium]|nr:cation:dicarboxylase symporter family transporter [Acidobacteriota bacterium]
MTMVRWVLKFMPVGVFALVLPMASRMGLSIVGVLGYYTILVCSILIIYTLLLYPIAVFAGRVSWRAFAGASAPAQAVAASSRSSMASLPALIDGAQRHLPYSQESPTLFFRWRPRLLKSIALCLRPRHFSFTPMCMD